MKRFPDWLRRPWRKAILALSLVVISTVSFAVHRAVAVRRTETSMKRLAVDLDAMVSQLPGSSGYVIVDLKTGIMISRNADKSFPSASLVKIPIMACVFKAEADGILDLDEKLVLKKKHRVIGGKSLKRAKNGTEVEIGHLVEVMIYESNNIATNMLSDRLGLDYINRTFKEFGLEKTNFDRYILDMWSLRRGIDNYTTPGEMAELLDMIYSRRLVSARASDEMMAILQKQQIKDRIPRWLPEDLVIANKTGSLRRSCHDAGIVFSRKGDFLICVLTQGVRSRRRARNFIREAAYRTYLNRCQS